ncbi:MAG: Npt1/Npt2 family nucleotide transporter, partial [Nevskiales bacterium]
VEGWRALRGNRYLALIALMLLMSQIAEPIVEYQFMHLVEQAYPEREARTAYLSHFLSVLSGIALLVNLLVTPLIHRRLGAVAGLLVQPLLLGVAALTFALQSRLFVGAAMKIADRGLSYSINRASRELLYVPVDPATIYRAKAWIDMVGYRAFKIAGNAVILLLTQWLPWKLSYEQLSWVVLGFCGLWIWAVLRVREDYSAVSRAALNVPMAIRPATD